uniref:Uncharacterized protein n=1 Tax=viral metagenome TaxID=1070528 RepID=A0A6H1ZFD0_9ZZZZ
MAQHKLRFALDEKREAVEQVKRLRGLYKGTVGLYRWTKRSLTRRRDGSDDDGYYIGFGEPVDLPVPLKMACVKIKRVMV